MRVCVCGIAGVGTHSQPFCLLLRPPSAQTTHLPCPRPAAAGADSAVEWSVEEARLDSGLLQRLTQQVLPQAFLGLEANVKQSLALAEPSPPASGALPLPLSTPPSSSAPSSSSSSPSVPSSGALAANRFDLGDSLIPEGARPGGEDPQLAAFDWQRRTGASRVF